AHENLLIVVRIHADLAEVHRPLILVTHELPGLAAVFGAVHAASIGIGRRILSAAAPTTAATTALPAATTTHARHASTLPRPRPAPAPAPRGPRPAPSDPSPPPNPPRPRCGPPSAAVPPPVPALAPTSICA